ncbi:glutathione peroxidase [Chitinophaga rupis]|uniref:Glutathione peroxidase n=1 Tax=Chitinophaga rupis TaxID=573321 RepID=A0A1H7VHK2_9BACT|nr:glutathione peroxidase [Chitinophaga rupis]SEM08389.1 glutathione peroxidase [Chitinophaga rupis]
MTGKQSFLKKLYPLIMRLSRLFGSRNKTLFNEAGKRPPVPLSSLTIIDNQGNLVPMSKFNGKKLLLVNTASDCGFTGQYKALQQLQELMPELVIIGFPANDFSEQEKGSDKEIAQFCQANYGVTFMLAAKSSVVKGAQQNQVFRWLSDMSYNGWNQQAPEWNFSKYVVNASGVLLYYFGPAVSPLSEEVLAALR